MAADPLPGLPSPLTSPIPGGNAFEQTVERLVRSIKLGVIANGERLPPERDLAESLQVGRTTLREALEALRTAGYVETRRGRAGGTFVVYQPRRTRRSDAAAIARGMGDGLQDALDFRKVVEGGSAALAASRALSDSDVRRLRGLLAQCHDAPDDVSRRGFDSRLHLAVAELAGAPTLLAAVTDVQLRVAELLAAIPVLERNIHHSDDQHTEMVEAIVAGDPDRARLAVEEHCDATSALLRGFLE